MFAVYIYKYIYFLFKYSASNIARVLFDTYENDFDLRIA